MRSGWSNKGKIKCRLVLCCKSIWFEIRLKCNRLLCRQLFQSDGIYPINCILLGGFFQPQKESGRQYLQLQIYPPFLIHNQPAQMLQPPISPKHPPQETQPYWSEHITTLMALELQFVFHKRPGYEQRTDHDAKTPKRKNIEYESGFLFSGRKEDKEAAGNIEELVMSSHSQNIKKVYGKAGTQRKKEGVYVLEKMIKTMLSLKHSTIIKEFIELYEELIRKILKIEFEAIRQDEPRRAIVAKIAEELARIIKNKSRLQHAGSYKQLGHFVSSKEKEMLQFLKAEVYCFLAQLHNFNINEYYVQAFTFEEEERRAPRKKKKLQ